MHRSPRSNEHFPSVFFRWTEGFAYERLCVVYQSLVIHFASETITFGTNIAPSYLGGDVLVCIEVISVAVSLIPHDEGWRQDSAKFETS